MVELRCVAMKPVRILISFFIVCSITLPAAYSQDVSTEGTDFWVSFMGNGFKTNDNGGDPYLKTEILISSLQDCSGTVSNPNTGWSTPFTIEANGLVFIDIPEEVAYMSCDDFRLPLDKSLHIVTDQPVSVYCANAARYSFDASYVLPTPALADDYIIQTYDQSSTTDDHTSAFLIIAVDEGETIVDITPTVKTLDNKPANQTFSITLQQGQVYQVRSHHTYSFISAPSRDLSGSRVTAHDCKKIAVFNGSNLTQVPTNGNDSDCIFEQAMPLQSWGKQFVVTASLGRQYKDYVKITSASNNNEIIVNGQHYATLNANESKSFKMQETSYYIETSSRCAVYLYNHSKDGSANSSYGLGAPSMVWIAPIEQRINELAFNTFNDEDPEHVSVDKHYVNIIVESDDIDNVILDGNPISANLFNSVAGTSDYMFYQQEISHGAHHLSCEGGFNAHVYGFGNATGYAYMIGSKAADLSTSIMVNEETVNLYDTIADCTMEDITFLADVNLSNYELIWDFGDGTTSNDNPATHQYENNGLYEASLTVTTDAPPCGGASASNATFFYVNSQLVPNQTQDTAICFKGPDTYVDAMHGFSVHYDRPGVYHDTDTIINENGCESYVTLNLTVSDLNDLDSEPITGQCDYYDWRGHHYTVSGHYTDTVASESECYSVYHLDLDLVYSPKPKIHCATPHAVVFNDTIAVITNTEFFSFQYDFSIEDTLGHIDNWEFYDWHISKPSWTAEPFEKDDEPDKHFCRVYVAEPSNEKVELSCTVYNHCVEDSITCSFFLKSSFFGLDEQETAPADFSIVPNPNNGDMELRFENLMGKVNVKVYDLHGILVDEIETYNGPGTNTLHYAFEKASPGIYFFVSTAKEGTIAKKVIIK